MLLHVCMHGDSLPQTRPLSTWYAMHWQVPSSGDHGPTQDPTPDLSIATCNGRGSHPRGCLTAPRDIIALGARKVQMDGGEGVRSSVPPSHREVGSRCRWVGFRGCGVVCGFAMVVLREEGFQVAERVDTLPSPSPSPSPLAPARSRRIMRPSCYNAVLPNLPGAAVGDTPGLSSLLFSRTAPSPHVCGVCHTAETRTEQLRARGYSATTPMGIRGTSEPFRWPDAGAIEGSGPAAYGAQLQGLDLRGPPRTRRA